REEEGGQQQRSIEVVAGATTQGVRGRPRLLFCGVVAGPFAHGLLLPHEPPPSPVRHPNFFILFLIPFYLFIYIGININIVFICILSIILTRYATAGGGVRGVRGADR